MSSWTFKLDFHPVACRVVNGDVVQAAHGPTGSTNSGVVPPPFQLTYSVNQHPVAMKERHYGPHWLHDDDDDDDDSGKQMESTERVQLPVKAKFGVFWSPALGNTCHTY